MDKEFWLTKWEEKDTKFDQHQVNSNLMEHEKILGSLKNKKVLIPLCGKSIDILWFLKQGAEVIGIELNPIALELFFAENNLVYKKINKAPFIIYQADSLKFICGDFFQLDKDDVGDIDLVYDRASLIALDSSTRLHYADKISQLSCPQTKIFLITLFYKMPSSSLGYPPYSVRDKEVHSLFSKNFHVQSLAEKEIGDIMPHLAQRGLTDLKEMVYLLTRLK